MLSKEFKSDDSSHNFTICGLSQLSVAFLSTALWMCVSSGLIMINKELLSSGFPYPMCLSGLGMLFSGIASYVTCKHLRLVDANKQLSIEFYIKHIMPVGLFMALTLAFGNLVYLYLSVSFIQMLKAFTPVITMVALFVSRLETPTNKMVLSVCMIAVGTAIASAGVVNLNYVGLLIMFLSESFEATRLVMTQVLLTGLKFHPIEGLMYLAPACTFWLFMGSLMMEVKQMVAENAMAVVAARPWAFALAAVMGFAVNSLAYIVIQTASSLTLKVMGTVKNAFVVFLGVFLLGESMTWLQGIGYGVSVVAFYWYQQVKTTEIRARSQPSTPVSKE